MLPRDNSGPGTRSNAPWPDVHEPYGSRRGNGEAYRTRADNPRLGGERTPAPGPGGPKRTGSMRGPLVVTGVLGAVLVLGLGLVAVVAMHGSPNGSAVANLVHASASTGNSRTSAAPKPSASHKATASPKPKPKASPKPTAASLKPSLRKTAASSVALPAPALLTVPAGWKLEFDPSFAGTQLNTGTWATCYDYAESPSVGCDNNPTAEKEWYIPSQVSVGGGTLNLAAKQETTQGLSTSDQPETYTCRSGMVTSKPGFNFTYGLVQVTAKLPYGPGLWPALWLAATSDQWPPELDIMEHWYSEPQMKVYDHTVGMQYIGGPVPTPADLSAGFHTYSLLWTKDRVTWYLDGAQVFTTTSYVPQQAMYFIANVADDSTATGACTGTMEIQSVKVWQP